MTLTRRRIAHTAVLLLTGSLTVATTTACGSSAHRSAVPALRDAPTSSAAAQTSSVPSPAPTSSTSAAARTGSVPPSSGGEPSRTSRPATPDSSPKATTTGSPKPSTSKPPAGPPVPAPLPADSLPNAAAVDWQPTGRLTPMPMPPDGVVRLNECAAVHGAVAWNQQGYASAQDTPAQEDILSFADPAAAEHAFQAVLAAMTGCEKTTQDLQRARGVVADARVTATATATGVQGSAWSRRWTGVAGMSAGGPQTNHVYLIRHDSTVIVASFAEFGANPPHPYDPAGDPAVLAVLAAHAG